MADREGFLRAILDSPANNSLRLVFADWLEEQGETILAQGCRQNGWWLLHPVDRDRWLSECLLIWVCPSGDTHPVGVVCPAWPTARCTSCTRHLGRVVQLGKWKCPSCFVSRLEFLGRQAEKQHFPDRQHFCPTCERMTEELVGDGCCSACQSEGWRMGRRGWRRLGDYDS